MINNVETLSGDYCVKWVHLWYYYSALFPLKPFFHIRMWSQTQPANHGGEDSKSIILMHLLFGSFQVLNIEFPVNTTRKRIVHLYYKKMVLKRKLREILKLCFYCFILQLCSLLIGDTNPCTRNTVCSPGCFYSSVLLWE